MTRIKKISILVIVFFISMLVYLIVKRINTPPSKNTQLSLPSNNLPTPLPIAQHQKQILQVNWKSKPQVPTTLSTYADVVPLIDSNLVSRFVKAFGFGVKNKKKTLTSTSELWSDGYRSLFVSYDKQQLTYINPSLKSSSAHPSQTAADKIVTDLLSSVFNNYQSLFQITNQNFNPYLVLSNEYFPDQVDIKDSNILQFTYPQIIDHYPVVVEGPQSQVLTLTVDGGNQIRKMSLFGGFSSATKDKNRLTMTAEQIIDSSSLTAKPILIQAQTATASLIDSSPAVALNVDKSSIVYLYQSSSLTPALLLNGTLTGDNFPDTPASYLMPILSSSAP